MIWQRFKQFLNGLRPSVRMANVDEYLYEGIKRRAGSERDAVLARTLHRLIEDKRR